MNCPDEAGVILHAAHITRVHSFRPVISSLRIDTNYRMTPSGDSEGAAGVGRTFGLIDVRLTESTGCGAMQRVGHRATAWQLKAVV